MLENTNNLKSKISKYIKENQVVDTLLGEIELKERLGEGGNAIVFNADWGRSEVAVKILAEDCSRRKSKRYLRFVTEFKEIIKLSNTTAVIPVYMFDLIEIEEHVFPYFVMKKYSFTLDKWVKDNPIDSTESLFSILDKLINCMEIIHNHNIIHRDLKPQNILIDENENIVLGDFGISWFDPEHYDRLAKTEKGDRLANFAFSPPEQFQKNPLPHPTMDIFALGQIVQWLVTGDTVRGTGRITLSSINSSFEPLDQFVEQLLQYNPMDRPQNMKEVKELLEEVLSPNVQEPSEYEVVLRKLRTFDDILRFSFPGQRGLLCVKDPEKINELLSALADKADILNLWWTQGKGDSPLGSNIEKLDDETWLIDFGEHKIEEIWVRKDSYSLDHQFILLQCAGFPSFGIYEGEYKYEEAAWFEDRYISRAEYDDGVANIDGKSVWIEGRAQLRTREMERDFLFIGTDIHPIILNENSSKVEEVYKKLKTSNKVEEEYLRNLGELRKHRISMLMS